VPLGTIAARIMMARRFGLIALCDGGMRAGYPDDAIAGGAAAP
jgi:hypothetical protein